jgi:hypothetical protein
MIKRALIVDKRYGELILSGKKNWELRTNKVNVRGLIGIIFIGEVGFIQGEVRLVGCMPRQSITALESTQDKHHAPRELYHTHNVPWILDHAVKFDVPKIYKPKPGQQIWVRYDDNKQ